MPVGAGGSGRPGFAKGRYEPLWPPGAVPDRPVGAGGDSLAVGQSTGWTGIMNVLPSGSLQGASGSANMAA